MPAPRHADRSLDVTGPRALRSSMGNAALTRWLSARRPILARMMGEDDAPSEPTLHRDNESEYSATWLGNEAGSLTLYWDEASETYWINNIETEPPYRRRGIASALLQMAIAEHGIVYASTQPSAEDTATDTRHLEPDGLALVTRLIRRGFRGLALLHPRDVLAHALPAPPLERGQRLITQYFQPPPRF